MNLLSFIEDEINNHNPNGYTCRDCQLYMEIEGSLPICAKDNSKLLFSKREWVLEEEYKMFKCFVPKDYELASLLGYWKVLNNMGEYTKDVRQG